VAFRARRRYRPGTYPGRITLFRLREQPATELYRPDPELGWHGLAAGGLDIVDIDGTHGLQFQDPWVAANAAKLRERLAEARRAASGSADGGPRRRA
jgi:thioesterase domain-containing protein